MTPQHEEFASIESDDALLDAVAARGYVDDDPAGALLADIVGAVDRIGPSMGDARRRGRRHRGGIWGISLGVSIAVAAGGGLSAAADGRLPEPVQHVVSDLGQVEPPAIAEQPTPTVTEGAPADAPAGDLGGGGGSDSTGPAQSFPREVDQHLPWQLTATSVPAHPWSGPVAGSRDPVSLRYPSRGTWPVAQPTPQPPRGDASPSPSTHPYPSACPAAPSPSPSASGHPTSSPAPASPYPHSAPAGTPSPAPAVGDGSPAPGWFAVPGVHLMPSPKAPSRPAPSPSTSKPTTANGGTAPRPGAASLPQASSHPAPQHPGGHSWPRPHPGGN